MKDFSFAPLPAGSAFGRTPEQRAAEAAAFRRQELLKQFALNGFVVAATIYATGGVDNLFSMASMTVVGMKYAGIAGLPRPKLFENSNMKINMLMLAAVLLHVAMEAREAKSARQQSKQPEVRAPRPDITSGWQKLRAMGQQFGSQWSSLR